MCAAFTHGFAPLPSETILDVGVTSDQSYTSSNHLEALYPHKNRITTILNLMTEVELRRAMSRYSACR